jgi:hypothetical protein
MGRVTTALGLLAAVLAGCSLGDAGSGLTGDPAPRSASSAGAGQQNGVAASPGGAPGSGSGTGSDAGTTTPAKDGGTNSSSDATTPPPSVDAGADAGPTAPMGWPNATNTGVRPGVALVNSGPVTSTHDGQVISGLNVTGYISIVHNDVIVEDCRVNCTGELGCIGIPEPVEVTGAIVRYTEAFAVPLPGQKDTTYAQGGIGGWMNDQNGTHGDIDEIAFCNVHGVDNSLYGGTGYIHDNYAHDFVSWHTGDPLHQDGLQTYGWKGAGGLRFIHNTIIGIATVGDATPTNYDYNSSAIALIEGMHDFTIADNFLAGGGYTMYGPSQFGQPARANVHVTNNVFSTEYAPNCGYFGPAEGFVPGPGWQWSGNVFYPSGAPVNP